jgi:hypothetical protein
MTVEIGMEIHGASPAAARARGIVQQPARLGARLTEGGVEAREHDRRSRFAVSRDL